MNSPTITMERKSALAKLEEYEAAAKTNPRLKTELDQGIMQGYRVLARGGRLVDVNGALKAGGLNLAGLPKLAIGRAHVQEVRWRAESNGGYRGGKWTEEPDGSGVYDWSTWGTRVTDDRVRWSVAPGTFDPAAIRTKNVVAKVPLVPLPLRPVHKLHNYFILWEANWMPEPPRDPYLLRQLAGSLMEIVAEWELTELEVAAVKNATVQPR